MDDTLNNNILDQYTKFINKELDIIVIITLGRAGSLFLEGLLDSDEIITSRPISVSPSIIKIHNEQVDKLSNGKILSLRNFIQRNIKNSKQVSVEVFMKIFDYIVENTKEEINGLNSFKLFYFILIYMRDININNVKYLLAHQHMLDENGVNVEEFYKKFNNHYFIFPVKNSKIQMQSLFRHIHRALNDNIASFYSHLYKFALAYNFYTKNKNNSYIVMNEELNNTPKETMNKLLKWLNIEYSTCYLECTNQNKPWGAIQSTKKDISGSEFSTKHIENKDNNRKIDNIYIELVHGEILYEFGYEINYIKTKLDYIKYSYLLLTYSCNNIYPYSIDNGSLKKNYNSFVNNKRIQLRLAKNSLALFKQLSW